MKKTDKNYQQYLEQLKQAWGNDQHMIDYCIKTTSQVVLLNNGKYVFAFDTPSIKTNFCFGYSTCGQGPTYDECRSDYNSAEKHMEQYFLNQNLGDFDYFYRSYFETDDFNKLYYRQHYFNGGKNLVDAHVLSLTDFTSGLYTTSQYELAADQNDIEIIREAIREERIKFEKRLQTYWKRYGNKNIRTWTYWIDE